MSSVYRFVGAGNIVRAILKGTSMSGKYPEEKVGIFDVNESVRKDFGRMGYEVFSSIGELVKDAAVVALAVTPQVIGSIAEELKENLTADTILFSVVAGIDFEWYREHLGQEVKVIRCMPTLTAQVGMGSYAVCCTENVTPEEFRLVEEFLSVSGVVEVIPEKLMTEVVALNGSAPGYFYYMSRIVLEEAVRMGFDKTTALRLFAGTMKGSAQTMLSSDMSVERLEEILRLPGGTTVAALEKMEALGFEKCVTEGLRACVDRCRELGKN